MGVAEPVTLGGTLPLRRRTIPTMSVGRLEKIGLAVLALTTIGALVVPLLAPHAPTLPVAAGPLLKPSAAHLLGTDDLSRDIASRVLYGIRSSWFSAIAVIAITGLRAVASYWQSIGFAQIGNRVLRRVRAQP